MRILGRILLMFAAASVLGTLISAGLLAWMAGEATPPGFEEKLRREAGSLAAAVEADPANTQWLERLLDPEMRLTTFAHVMANTVPDEETRKAISSEGYADPNAPVLVLDSAQLARRSLIDKLIFDEAGDVAGTDVEIAEIFVVRGGLPFRAAFSGSEFDWGIASHPGMPREELAKIMEVWREGRVTADESPYMDEGHDWLCGYAPVHGADGKILGVVLADHDMTAVTIVQRRLMRWIPISVLLSLILTIGAGALSLRPIATRLRTVTSSIDAIRRGDFAADVPGAERPDEIGGIARALNDMLVSLRENERMRSVLVQTMSAAVAREMISGKPEIEGAEREATVMFTDIRGFTSLSEGMSAREVIRLLNEYFARMAPAVERAGGIVDKFLGDGMLAVFGAPVVIENDALAAVRAALEMRRALEELNRERTAAGEPVIEIGIGINTGAIVTGALGSNDRRNFTVLGQTVNIAARLCAMAAPGQIVISQATWLRVKRRADGRPLGPMELKGVTFAVDAFEVLDLRETSIG